MLQAFFFRIIEQGIKLKGHKNLASIKGIGSRSATVLLSVIDDVNDFADEDKLAAKRYSPYLRNYYERIKSHRGSGKAIIATSRKLLGIIYSTLKNDWIFEDFPNFVIANSCVKK